MVLATTDRVVLPQLADLRWNEYAVIEEYHMRTGSPHQLSNWHNTYSEVNRLLSGTLRMKDPSGRMSEVKTVVQNVAHSALRDLQRTVAEDRPSLRIPPRSRSDTDIAEAAVWQSIGHTYWWADRCYLKEPKLVMDMAKGGAAFLLSYVEPDGNGGYAKDHPCHKRLRIPGCFPTWDEETLVDMLHVSMLKRRVLAAMYPNAGVPYDAADTFDSQVIDFWTKDETWKVARVGQNKIDWVTLAHERHGLGRVPIAWHMTPSHNDFFEGEYDQMDPTMQALNTIAWLVIDNAVRQVYPTKVKEGEVDTSREGPDGEIVMDMGAGKVSYLQAPAVNPSLMPLMQELTEFARGTGAFPASRQGSVTQSIASAAFISASQGEKASQGRAMERGMADIRQQSVELDYQLDRMYFGGSKKRLFYPVGDKAYYTPAKDIPEEIPWVECVYPAAGYDPINADVRNIQKVGAGLKSKEEAMSEDPSITNAFDSLQKQYKEQSVGMVFQRGLSDPSFDYLMFAELMGQGIEPLKAVGQVRQAMEAKMAQQQALQAQQAQQQLPGAAGPEGQLSALQLEKGAVPGQTAPVTPAGPLPQPAFAGGPLTNILVGR